MCVFFSECISSCHCIICTIVMLKLRTCCIEVNYIAVLKVAHLLVCLETINMKFFALKRTRRMVENI